MLKTIKFKAFWKKKFPDFLQKFPDFSRFSLTTGNPVKGIENLRKLDRRLLDKKAKMTRKLTFGKVNAEGGVEKAVCEFVVVVLEDVCVAVGA